MNDNLNNLTKSIKAKQHLLIPVLIVVFAVGFALVRYWPLKHSRDSIEKKLISQREMIYQREIKQKQIPLLNTKLKGLEEKLKKFESQVPDDTQLGEFLGTIAELMDGFNLSEQQIAPEDEIETEKLSCIPVTMKCKGRLSQISEFYNSLQKLDRVIRVEKFQLKNDSDLAGVVSMEARAVIYYTRPEIKS